DVREHVDERANVARIGWKAWLRLDEQADRTDRRQATVGAGRGELDGVVDAWENRREDVRLEMVRVHEVILEQPARLVRLGERLDGQRAMGPAGEPQEPLPERLRQRPDVAPDGHRRDVALGHRVGMTGRGDLVDLAIER